MISTSRKHIGNQVKMDIGQPQVNMHARDGCADGKWLPDVGAETSEYYQIKRLEKEIMESNLRIASLECQISVSQESKQQNTLQLSHEQEREQQQELRLSQERELEQKQELQLREEQERERQQELRLSQEREREQHQELRLSQEREREHQQELQLSQEREREHQQELHLSKEQEKEWQQELQLRQQQKVLQLSQKHNDDIQQKLGYRQEHHLERQQFSLEHKDQQQELWLSQEPGMERQTTLLGNEPGRLLELEAFIRMTAQIEEFQTFDDTSIFFSQKEWTEWKEVEELLKHLVIKEHSNPQALLGSATARPCETPSVSEPQDSGNRGTPEISPSNLDSISYKRPPGRLLSIKERLKLLHWIEPKEPTTQPKEPSTQTTISAVKIVEVAASSGSPQVTAGDKATSSEKRKYVCPECGKTFNSKAWLTRHKKAHNELQCGVHFSWQKSLSQHQKIHAREKSTLEEPSAWHKGNELNSTIVEDHDQQKCGNGVIKKKRLRKPRNPLPGGVTYPCDKCEKKFVSTYYRYMHKKKVHPIVKPLGIKLNLKLKPVQQQRNSAEGNSTSMEWCLVKKQGLQPGQKSFLCENCGKSFSRKAKLKQHQRTHTGLHCEEFTMDV